MLTITSNAAEAIRAIVESTEVPDEGGLRISIAQQNGSQASLELAVSPAPMEGDEVLEEEGAHVFLDEMASLALEDKSLDAHIEGDQISFGIEERDEAGPAPPL
ncbi:MAG: Fe-S cluster assembly protein HesB [Thermoleophilaceae bacterium]